MKARFYFFRRTLILGHKIKYQTNDFWHTYKFIPLRKIYLYARKHYKKYADYIDKKEITYLTFIGTERTGHSLIGGLLDAHKEIVISHEINALKLFTLRYPVEYIYSLIIQNSERCANLGRGESGYSYIVKDGFQGYYKNVKVISDKDAKRDTSQLVKYNDLLDEVQNKVHKLKVLHVIRNPYDNISTICRKKGYIELSDIERYFKMTEACDVLIKSEKYEIKNVHHDDMISNPKQLLQDLLSFLELENKDSFIEKAAAVVHKSSNKSRNKINWSDEYKEIVNEKMQNYDYLKHYTF